MTRRDEGSIGAYRFSDERWERIKKACKDANPDALEEDQDGIPFRAALEFWVNAFLIARREEKNFDRERARAAMKRIARKARRLRQELEKVDKIAWHGPAIVGGLHDPRRDYTRWEILIEDLRATEEVADEQYRVGLKKVKRPANWALELFLIQLAQLYEEATSRRASTSTNPHTGAVGGAFPLPVKIGKRRIAGVQSEVSDWLAERMQERCQRPTQPVVSTDAWPKGE